jgi:hypothetical protein
MGGQACVFYGAAEFSKDCDVVVLVNSENLQRLTRALGDLQAECIAVPPFQAEFLLRGHAVHFRCRHPEAAGMRLDVMATLRGCDPFEFLWERRTTLEGSSGTVLDLLALPDLVKAKKTQRDKDWPMIRRLVETHLANTLDDPTPQRVQFWLTECRTPKYLVDLVRQFPDEARELIPRRPLLAQVAGVELDQVERLLIEEELDERGRDRAHWQPLKQELERLRQQRLKGP